MGSKHHSVNTNVLWLTISFTFLSCCFGSGLLAIPRVATETGMIPFILMNTLAVAFSYFCFYQILLSAKEQDCNVKTLTQLISMYYGKVWLFFFDLSIIFCLLPISYIAVSADYFRNFLTVICNVKQMDGEAWKTGMKFITCLCVMYPLTLIKTIKVLNYVASMSLLFVFVSVIFVIIKFGIWEATGIMNGEIHTVPLYLWPYDDKHIPNVLKYICMFFSLYSMHASIVCVMYEYRHDFYIQTNVIYKQLSRAIFYVALPVAFTVYTCYGIIGVLMFNYKCPTPAEDYKWCIEADGNVLLSFKGDIAATVIELLFSIVVFVSFPCMLYPIRRSVLYFTRLDKKIKMDTCRGYVLYNLVGLGITLVCLLVAVFLDSVSDIYSFTANLLGIILYGMSGVMLWYKRGRAPIKTLAELNNEGATEQDKDEYNALRYDGYYNEDSWSSPQSTAPVETPIPKCRTTCFWIAIITLLLLNLAAIGSYIYIWVI